MNYADLGAYINQQVRAVDSKFNPWTDGFNFDNVPQASLDKRYHINMNSTSTGDGQQAFTDTIDIFVQASFKGGNKVQQKIFESLDLMRNVRDKIVNAQDLYAYNTTLDPDQTIQKIVPLSIVAEALPTNDDDFKITISLQAITAYTFCS